MNTDGLEGWDPKTGWPKRSTLEQMDMEFVADGLQAAGKLGGGELMDCVFNTPTAEQAAKILARVPEDKALRAGRMDWPRGFTEVPIYRLNDVYVGLIALFFTGLFVLIGSMAAFAAGGSVKGAIGYTQKMQWDYNRAGKTVNGHVLKCIDSGKIQA